MLSLLNVRELYPSWDSLFMNKDIENILTRIIRVLDERRSYLVSFGKGVYPDNNQIFEMFGEMAQQDVKKIIIFPHPYSYDSGTGIPIMINNERTPTRSLNNILKVFRDAKTNDFSSIWKTGVFFLNASMTEEENGSLKIPHEVLWSKFIEKFMSIMSESNKKEGIDFIFTGLAGCRYKSFIRISNTSNKIIEVPPVTSEDFPRKLKEVLSIYDNENLDG
jgi:uracil DNA glycosylase